jgi:RNA polymerase sigma factor (sigma-70 family)
MVKVTHPCLKEDGRSEFELCVAAKNGNSEANLQLWERYKPVAFSILKYVPGMTTEEKLSEAYMLFLHKLGLFDPLKVLKVRNPDTFTFSYMMTGGLKNLRRKLFYNLKKDFSNVSWTPFEDGGKVDCPYKFTEFNPYYQEKEYINSEYFEIYNPEKIVFCPDEELPQKVKKLYAKITKFQHSILSLRREGMTQKEIAETLHCSLTTVKTRISEAKRKAARIFGNQPGLKITLAG